MLQPDVFFAYGLASGLAVAGGRKLSAQERPLASKYFVGTLLWLSLLYVPQVLYLLFRFPGWESMYAFKELVEIPPWFMALYLALVMVMGIGGFYVTTRLLKSGKTAAALAQVGWSMGAATLLVFVGWDGSGYRRLLFTGAPEEWARGPALEPAAFFSSPVFLTLLWLEALVLAPYCLMAGKWIAENRGRLA